MFFDFPEWFRVRINFLKAADIVKYTLQNLVQPVNDNRKYRRRFTIYSDNNICLEGNSQNAWNILIIMSNNDILKGKHFNEKWNLGTVVMSMK